MSRNIISAVYDITIAYKGDIPTGEQEILNEQLPSEMHFYVKRYLLSELPLDNEDQLASWCNQRWKEKEQLLEQFYKNGYKFPQPFDLENSSLATPAKI